MDSIDMAVARYLHSEREIGDAVEMARGLGINSALFYQRVRRMKQVGVEGRKAVALRRNERADKEACVLELFERFGDMTISEATARSGVRDTRFVIARLVVWGALCLIGVKRKDGVGQPAKVYGLPQDER